jgi:hypothetical protein
VVTTVYNLIQTNISTGCQATAHVKVIIDSSCLHRLIEVNPNPANNNIIVQLDVNNNEPKFFELIDTKGNLVLKKDLNFTTNINVQNIPQGIYFYSIRVGFGLVLKSGKLIIRH